MFRRMLRYSILVLTVALTAFSVSAESDSLSATINVHSRTQVADKTLEPGEYHVVFEGNQAGNDLCAFVSPVKSERNVVGENGGKFLRPGMVVAEVPCTLKTQQNLARADLAVTSQNRLTEVQFRGRTEVVEFPS